MSLTRYDWKPESVLSSLDSLRSGSPEGKSSIRIEELMGSEYFGPSTKTPQFSSKPPRPFEVNEDEIIAMNYDIPTKLNEDSLKDSARSNQEARSDRSITVISAFNGSLQPSDLSEDEDTSPLTKEVSFRDPPLASLSDPEFTLFSSFFEGVSASMKKLEANVTSSLSALETRVSSLEDKASLRGQDLDNLLDFACSLEDVMRKVEERLNVGLI